MKIAFLSRYQTQDSRGAESFVKELSTRLLRKHDIDVLSGKEADDLKKVLDGQYDIVVPINGRIQSLKMSLGRLVSKYKLLISGHSGVGKDDIWNIAVAKPDVFVALTDNMTVWARQWAWGTKVVKIPNGVDLNKFSPFGEKIETNLPKPIILSVGALVWYKHHERVIRAMGKIGAGSLLIVGKGPEKEKLISMGRDILGKRIKIEQFDYEEMPKVYRSADLFTLPSWDREAFGIVYLEALASGLGVVAPDDGPRREIIGEGGLLANVENVEDYSRCIKEALKLKWKEKARVQARKFSWEKVAGEYEKLMLGMLH